MSNARNAAVALYTLALANAATADWQAVATSLFDALPKSKAAASDVPAWWSDYAIPKAYSLESLDVTFADGVTFRCNLVSGKNKPPRVAGACRGAIGLYRAKHGQAVAVPAFSRIVTASGQDYDAATCSALTDELRAIPGTVQGSPMTAARIDWMASELARREAGFHAALVKARAVLAAARGRDVYDRRIAHSTAAALVAIWKGPVRGARKELAMMRHAYAVQRGEAAPVAVAQIAPVVAPVAAPVALPVDPEALEAAWCEAVAGSYGDCVPCEIPGTVETVAELLREAGGESSHVTGIVEDLQSVEAVALQASEFTAVPADDAWEPTAETHPVIAYCLSHKAREILWAKVQDGTFPADGATAKAGAWRLTLADAQDLQDVESIRFKGMPRKAYTRRPAAPVAPIAPVSTFVRMPAGAAFMEAGRPATLHAPQS